MDPQLQAALISLGLIVFGTVGALVKAAGDRITRDLAENTAVTRETKVAADRRLGELIEAQARSRDTILGLRAIVREREDRIAYLVARHPEVESTLRAYTDRRQQRATVAEEHAAERRILEEFIDDPTGTDAGAHPRG